MNRILFLPLNRNLSYFYLRALRKGHIPFFGRWKIEGQKGKNSKYWRNDFFGSEIDEIRKSSRFYGAWILYWSNYFIRRKITHIVTDMEANVAILAALDTAKRRQITRSYIMHGEGDVYDFSGNLPWYRGGLYDYFYARNVLTKGYIQKLETGMKVEKFNRKQGDSSQFATYIPGKKRVLYAPLYAGVIDKKQNLVSAADHDLRCVYNKEFLKAFIKSGHEIWWCQDPRLDKEPNPILEHVEMLDGAGKIKWIKGKAKELLKKVDCAVTDVGSAFFFEAINAGKPVLCLYHKPTAPRLKPEAKWLFQGCLQSFKSHGEVKGKLRQFLEETELRKYVPWRYVNQESKVENAKLVWE